MSEYIRCFMFPDGTPGFFASGNVLLECSKYTCGEFGKAEFWCRKCCNSVLSAVTATISSIANTSSKYRLSNKLQIYPTFSHRQMA